MALTPKEVYEMRFERAMRGYNTDEVDTFLDGVIEELERRDALQKELQAKLQKLEEDNNRVSQMEDTLREALVLAQRRSDELLQSARTEIEEIRRDAQADAAAIRRQAEADAERIRSEAEAEAAHTRESVSEISRQAAAFRRQIREALADLTRSLDAQEQITPPAGIEAAEEAPAEAASEETDKVTMGGAEALLQATLMELEAQKNK